ncbi:HPr kinase/phosphorylase [Sphingosinicella soli]|uniref:Serine kinase of HPr protein (Carbohydrate metabolism regulator) n=1 Tax=Sphingosinicella soli TaxID=333708 RepID=A0A7W7B0Z6_9SPHN|nr:aldolase [Sphingosinicella soli]MBB4632034.1 serine kinase of HPr protein (carbohydrate metabolism regulator) [Sphingosinicella soli]
MRIHATAVSIGGRAVLLTGASGAGKSDLALRLIDRGAVLIADDQVELRAREGRLFAAPPEAIAGKIEVRGVGIVPMAFAEDVPVACIIDLDTRPERLPEPRTQTLGGVAVPVAAVDPREISAPLKVELLLSGGAIPLD